MTNSPFWQSIIVAAITVILNAISTWSLELFKISKSKETPTSSQEKATKAKDKSQRRLKVLSFILRVLLIFSQSYRIWDVIANPTSRPAFDAFIISLNIGSLFFVVIFWVLEVVVDRIYNSIDKTLDVTKRGFVSTTDVIKGILDSQKELTSIVSDLAKNVKKLSKKSKK